MKTPEQFLFSLDSAVDMVRLNYLMLPDFQIRPLIGQPSDVHVLDTFDHPLRRSGKLLLQHQNNLLLFDPKTASMSLQPCPANWRFVSDLPDGPIKDELSHLSPLRAFLTVSRGHMHAARLFLCDEKKRYARTYLYMFGQGSRMKVIGASHPLPDDTQGYRFLVKALRTQGAQALKECTDLYRFLGDDTPIYCSKPDIKIDPEAPVYDTARHIVKTFIQVARQNESGIQADYDTEFLHDYRVSLRKIRSLLSLSKGVFTEEETSRLTQAFADIMKHTNRLRDLDGYLLAKERYFSMTLEHLHQGLDVMFEIFTQERQQQLKQVAEMLRSERYQQTIQNLAEDFQIAERLAPGPKANEPILAFASRLIWKRYKKVCQAARRIDADTPDKQVHRLRIHCKKLRYVMEFFAPLFSEKKIKKLIQSLKRLQDNLGRFNDFSVQQRSLQEFLQNHADEPDHHSLQLAESIGALIMVLHQQQEEERKQIMEHFACFDNRKTRMAFKALFTLKTSS